MEERENSEQKEKDNTKQKVKRKRKEYIFQLTKAISNLKEIAVAEIIDSGVDVDATIMYSKTPLSYALEMGSENIALLLLKGGANPENGATCERSDHVLKPIHFASQLNKMDVVSMLLEKNVDVEARSSAGLSALHYAAYEGHINICCELIKYGADVNGLDDCHRTPLHRAAENGQTGIIELLVNSGAKLCVEDFLGITPLLMACYFNHMEAAKCLLSVCNNVNNCDKRGNSPLNIVCNPCLRNSESFKETTYERITTQKEFWHPELYHVDEEFVDILISYGANVEALNKRGASIFDYAKNTDYSQLVLLEKFVNAGLWVVNWSPETFSFHVFVNISSLNAKDLKAEFDGMLSHLQQQQMRLKQQCKRAIRKNINFSGGKNIQYYIGYLPLPTQLKEFLQ